MKRTNKTNGKLVNKHYTESLHALFISLFKIFNLNLTVFVLLIKWNVNLPPRTITKRNKNEILFINSFNLQ